MKSEFKKQISNGTRKNNFCNDRPKEKAKENTNKKCQLCKAGFDIWLSTLNFNPEREEKIRAHFSKYCPDCEPLEEKGEKLKIKNIITS